MMTIAIFIFLFLGGCFFWRKKQQEQRFNRSVGMTVSYMFQERPGQYSGDRNAKSGVFVFKAERNDDRLKNIVIRKVKPLHTALDVNLEQILVIPFEQKDNRKSDVSVRFKINRRAEKIEDLKGGRVNISGVLNFEERRPELFTATLSISDLYQKTEA
jgi:lipopolysaccharide export LptBFGC system permease protein LptF